MFCICYPCTMYCTCILWLHYDGLFAVIDLPFGREFSHSLYDLLQIRHSQIEFHTRVQYFLHILDDFCCDIGTLGNKSCMFQKMLLLVWSVNELLGSIYMQWPEWVYSDVTYELWGFTGTFWISHLCSTAINAPKLLKKSAGLVRKFLSSVRIIGCGMWVQWNQC